MDGGIRWHKVQVDKDNKAIPKMVEIFITIAEYRRLFGLAQQGNTVETSKIECAVSGGAEDEGRPMSKASLAPAVKAPVFKAKAPAVKAPVGLTEEKKGDNNDKTEVEVTLAPATKATKDTALILQEIIDGRILRNDSTATTAIDINVEEFAKLTGKAYVKTPGKAFCEYKKREAQSRQTTLSPISTAKKKITPAPAPAPAPASTKTTTIKASSSPRVLLTPRPLPPPKSTKSSDDKSDNEPDVGSAKKSDDEPATNVKKGKQSAKISLKTPAKLSSNQLPSVLNLILLLTLMVKDVELIK
ncbi:hypothetical protein VTL71DRAFT_14877 [Oculimacula yallundae]|uniref:Uncharacterized protein n=1 Tax=Oculimacula yallundae TaxID=86028 RepID=A0ABR4CF16_9HELO